MNLILTILIISYKVCKPLFWNNNRKKDNLIYLFSDWTLFDFEIEFETKSKNIKIEECEAKVLKVNYFKWNVNSVTRKYKRIQSM